MSVELTVEQLSALDSERDQPPHLIDPRTRLEYVLLPAEEYERVCEFLDEERARQVIGRIAMRNATARMDDVP